jgi:nucleotide-binding universal stress UspA family protein
VNYGFTSRARPDGDTRNPAYGHAMPSKKTNSKGPVIVVGYDGSPTSRAAVDHAARQAGRRGKVYVVHSYGPLPDWLGFPNYQRVLDDHRARGEATLDALAMTDDPLLATNFDTELLDSPPAEAITRVAETRGADEIVVGSRGLGRVRSALGSVSQEVLHRATVPVVVIPRVDEH